MAGVIFHEELHNSISQGCEVLWQTVAPLYGPSGKNVLFHPNGDIPMAAVSAASILQDLSIPEPAANLGLQLLRNAAQHVVSSAGAGASTTIILSYAIFQAGAKLASSGVNETTLRKGILYAAELVVNALREAAKPMASQEELKQVLYTAVPDKEICDLLLNTFDIVGLDGLISIEDSQMAETCMDAGGIRYDAGFASPLFANDKSGRVAELKDPYILIIDDKLKELAQLETLLVQLIQEDASLLIIAKDFSQEFLADLLTNVRHGVFQVVAANAPGYGDSRHRNMEALALACGAIRMDSSTGIPLEDCTLDLCGKAGHVHIKKDFTKILSPICKDASALDTMRRRVERDMDAEADPNLKESLSETCSILAGNSALIQVGGTNEVEMFERKRKLENALAAARCARKSGLLPGGGSAYLDVLRQLQATLPSLPQDLQPGAACLYQSLKAPVALIAENVGQSSAYIIQHILEQTFTGCGYDASGKNFCDMVEAGILDPAGILICALETAAETASSLLTVQAAVQ